MDRKSLAILVGSLLLLAGLYQLAPKLFPPSPVPPTTNVLAGATNSTGATNVAATTHVPVAPVAPPATVAVTPLATNLPEQIITLETPDAIYHFTSRGGGLKQVELKRFTETVPCGRRAATNNELASLNVHAPAPVMALRGPESLTGDQGYQLTRLSPTSVRAEKTQTNGLKLVKDFRLGSNYVLYASLRYENGGPQPLEIPPHALETGTATPMNAQDDGTLEGVYWWNGDSAEHVDLAWFDNRTLGCFPGTPRPLYAAGSNNVRWVAAHNQFFTIAVVAPTNAPGLRVTAQRIELPKPSPADIAADKSVQQNPHGCVTAMDQLGATLAPGQSLERAFEVYAGPKEFKTLSRLGNNLDTVMDFRGMFVVDGFFAKLLLLSMNGLHSLGLSYALSIIGITIIIKALFWPLTQASTRSMKRLQQVQPQLKAIQQKYKEDPAKLNRKTMEFMRENKINPLGGCLPMLVQIPVFFGFFTMIRSAIELRGESFLWACDLSKPDTVWVIPGLGFPVNPLPLIMVATQVWQMSLTPPSPGIDPAQQRLMRWMPIIFVFILYNYSAALTLYWTTQNLLSILQMKLTKTAAPAPAAPKAPARPAPAPRKKKS